MNIVVFDNSGLVENGDDFCVEVGTGSFAKELVDLGHKVTFYGQTVGGLSNTTDVFPLKSNGIKVIGIKRLNNKIFSYLRIYCLALKPILKADIVYFFYPSAMRFLIFTCILFRKRYGIYIRGIDDLENFESKIFFKKASFVLTVADFFTDYVNDIAKRKIASNIRPMIKLGEQNIVWNRSYSDGKNLEILFIGRMTNDKGVIELIHSISQLNRKGIIVKANLIGDGEYINELKDLSNNLGLHDLIHFKGPLFDKEEIIKYYLDADLFVLPTYHEGFPRTLYEAMILGIPIITTFVGGISSVMIDKFNCLRIEEKSIESLENGILFAIDNYEKFIEYAENARDTVLKILTNRKESHAELFNSIIKKS
ncbi:glycosyltransferase family 4 protein [Sphingobacterium sp. 1.A.4]|uniref:glycosyltransferase family 4 protein n=1 Tax=Sphingobacterium sp. 1.A.4 TaxID=2044603 RepID=UPI000C0BF238|nr:glycosyltransferase family 4 protein [Sphingobacterium sp. 1.A.4]